MGTVPKRLRSVSDEMQQIIGRETSTSLYMRLAVVIARSVHCRVFMLVERGTEFIRSDLYF
jgi:hypothetical protein